MYSCDGTCTSRTITASLCSAYPFRVTFVHHYNSFLGAFCRRASQIGLAVEPRTFSRGTTAMKQSREDAQAALPHLLPLPGLFPAHFNCSTNPPFPTVIQLCTSPDPAVRTVAIEYLCDNIPSKYLYKPDEFMKFTFIPVENEDGLHLGTIREVVH